MADRYAPACRARHAQRARQRAAVLQLGAVLGWPPDTVITFTEALTGRSWRHCGRVELGLVLREYQELVRVIQAKAARRATREVARLETAPSGGTDAAVE
ncbi:hypothetical protein [Nitrolancea hollandica]|nr:hypothetical protein [Nitrolancea hollandica]